jgi:HEPN domain-containing protein
MKWDEQAERLRRKAAGDEAAMLALLNTPAVPDDVIGFHAQQAVEKLLKALLSHRRVAFRRTHDLTELLDLLALDGVTIPPQIAEVRQLGPYAAECRYEDIDDDATEPFDRCWAVECVKQTRMWIESLFTCIG